ncbi:sensor histidine kinase [Chitinophaga pinensis]|uniref:Signal transduction histidine kinase, LytS n=1 Tax=Chitinophaga pinensis (strain ATCC 43595 / DSM 2588 / LMG 13176 / NBRC 15968 / NCIMB 11800 / UQM 2034) TaxID=485918 RepID=A0A979G808_CHIPD|nr:histidine kinase [Chitinophaga pinensis]ACU62594.1 signal transduction histidine kinase, LytS [Chitinophaga pinensis DSM 2588]
MSIKDLNILAPVRKHWRQILIILAIYTTWSVAVFLFLIGLQGPETTIKQFGGSQAVYFNFGHAIIKGTIVYYILIYHLALPLVQTRKWKRALLKCILFLILLTVYEYCWHFKKIDPAIGENVHISPHTFLVTTVILDVIMVMVSIYFATLITSNEVHRRKEELEKQKLQAELSAIRYQINPHFLFNSLSFIYTKTLKTSPEAAHAVHLLSEIMSYALDDWGELGTVPLTLEVDHMKKVIEMNQIRFNHMLKIKYQEHVEESEMHVPTLALVTLVENAFKHGDLNDEQNQVSFELNATKNRISFKVSNKKKKGPKEPSKGIGLSNVQQRLQLMYGAKQSFVIEEDENYYSNEIIINL